MSRTFVAASTHRPVVAVFQALQLPVALKQVLTRRVASLIFTLMSTQLAVVRAYEPVAGQCALLLPLPGVPV
ncbi:hypothetical protein ACIHCQ_00495 [Streptomyces sp. NPDC052236]|uniref:hypothetical protein n=1 Tax=Streptomyces sp. NPDC052236 TaxID=3365686 RepID=UPI0037D656F2